MTQTNHLITAVTGDPRSGTSLNMAMLMLAGYPISGEKFPGDKVATKRLAALAKQVELGQSTRKEQKRVQKNLAKRTAHAHDLNPSGFYEVPGVVIRGLSKADSHGGHAIKIISRGIVPLQTPQGMVGTNPGIVWKYIVCMRDPRYVAESQRSLGGEVDVVGSDGGNEWIVPRKALSVRSYLSGDGMLLK